VFARDGGAASLGRMWPSTSQAGQKSWSWTISAAGTGIMCLQGRFVQGSILDHALIDSLFREHKFQNVYHLAAYALKA